MMSASPVRPEDVEALLKDDAGELAIPLDRIINATSRPCLLNCSASSRRAGARLKSDPAFADGAFRFRVLRAGNLLILLQPDRGAHTDRKAGYHDTSVPPRHAYVALYAHLREVERIDALVHLGAHGTLEWLPGKALALSQSLLAGGGARPGAGDLSLHRQQSRRGDAGQASPGRSDARSSDAAIVAGRLARAAART